MKTNRNFIVMLCLAVCFTAIYFTACSKKSSNSLNATDQNFMQMAAYSNEDEVNFGQLAVSKSSNDSVTMFAQKMISDHTMGIMGLDSLASTYSLTLPTTIDSMHAAIKGQLMPLSGSSFDSAYIKGQVADHITTINLFQNEISNGSRQGIKDFATRTLPMLNMHLQMAQALAATIHP